MTPRRRLFRQGAALIALSLLGACVYAPDNDRIVRQGNRGRPQRRPWWRGRRRRY